jgi:hypothetical protein
MIPAKALEELARSPYYVSYIGKGTTNANFVRVSDYNQDQYESFIAARDKINETVIQFIDLYGMVAIVYDNLVDAYDKRVEEVKLQKGISARDDLTEINAYFASFIANFAMYLGCVPRKISSKRGDILELYKKATNDEYDCSFPYRLLCSLRNYTLHDTPPITGITGSSQLSKESNEIEVKYEVYIEKDKLLQNAVVAKKLANDFLQPPDNYPVIELATDAVISLKNIHWKTVKALLETVEDEVALIESIVALTPKNQPYIVSFLQDEQTKELNAHLELVPTNIIEISKIASKY